MEKIFVAVIFIGTGTYVNFFANYYEECEKYFLPNCKKDYFCFTDAEFVGEIPSNIKVISTKHKSWPSMTLERFHIILNQKDTLSEYDYIIYLDADMLVNREILEDEILTNKDFIGVYHPGFYKKKQIMPYERRKISSAYIDDDGEIYWQGCLWGGKGKSVIELCKILSERIDKDLEKDIVAEWHDESHLNKFFLDNFERVCTLGPEYAFPEVYDNPNETHNYPNIDPNNRKIIHLHKKNEEFHV
jgi:alpha-N-acetylglucosamine transferase